MIFSHPTPFHGKATRRRRGGAHGKRRQHRLWNGEGRPFPYHANQTGSSEHLRSGVVALAKGATLAGAPRLAAKTL